MSARGQVLAPVRVAGIADYDEAMRFTDLVFRPGQRGRRIVESQYPHLYRQEPGHARRLMILRDGEGGLGPIIGCIGVHPISLRSDEARISVGGIGIVGAHPERRGEGIMTRLLHAAITRMQRQRKAVSVLTGDRLRYGRFGWENGGCSNLFSLTPRSTGEVNANRSLRLLRLSNGARRSVWKRIADIADRQPYGVVRNRMEQHAVMLRKGKEGWYCHSGERFAYAVLSGPNRKSRPYVRVDEVGGESQLVQQILCQLMQRFHLSRLDGLSGPNPEEVEHFQSISESWSRITDGMVRVNDISLLCQQLEPLLRRRARNLALRGVVRFINPEGGDPGILRLGRGGRSYRIELDRQQLTRLLFGLVPVSEQASDTAGLSCACRSLLNPLLPIPLYLPLLNRV
ncbi:MAG: GNAT family N-acetyltransferase [Candidatus Latescibacterota bacterium]|nr:GNAT family N-acetyltransferase [Candidatus Latescibacterota bacterium]